MTDWLTELKFWDMVAQDARRLIICNPDHESRVKGYLSAMSMLGYHKVEVTPHCPTHKMYVMPLHWSSLQDAAQSTIRIDNIH